jgi:hypothetical protein
VTAELRRQYSAREFNRFPGAVARAAHRFGHVTVTHRGQESLLVMDASAARAAGVLSPTAARSLSNLLEVDVDTASWGEPPRVRTAPRIPQEPPGSDQ